jgi:predicted TIM-barrel fold metal-dependent hydrolase
LATQEALSPELAAESQQFFIIDTDVHAQTALSDPTLAAYIPARWREHLELVGMRMRQQELTRPRIREHAHRLDSVPPSGGIPGSDPNFAREQLLDTYGMHAGVLNNNTLIKCFGHSPIDLQLAIARALNEWHRDRWLAADPRWYTSIAAPYERPELAVKEIQWCREETGADSDRFVQLLMERRADYPIGNPRYWPVFEACEHYGIPIAFHVGGNDRVTACGEPNYYFDEHCDFALSNFNSVASLVFEGVFDRFPNLKFVFVEQSWSWVIPFNWRLDASWRLLKSEVPHLQRKPSEYVREHCYFTTQPMEEPENAEDQETLYRLLESEGMGDKLMFSSDYPHWDFDSPYESVPESFPLEWRRKILGGNASALYKIYES